ncbi:hypothetical protein [Gallaecimonas mangrovi]|uniref:hypothetical protein n=1 Tax=Gallaecimonas mangrovi TaxID=2291597 RepID=UPI000E205C9F|nr:hypothetical protein [Gallaecimonas mangrovi]
MKLQVQYPEFRESICNLQRDNPRFDYWLSERQCRFRCSSASPSLKLLMENTLGFKRSNDCAWLKDHI